MYQDALDRPVKAPYLTHIVQRGAVNQLRFCPYEVSICLLNSTCTCLQAHVTFMTWRSLAFLVCASCSTEAACLSRL